MEVTPNCCWCDQDFPDWQDLVEHLVQKHGRENELIGVYKNGKRSKRSRTAKCWCGRFFDWRGIPSDAIVYEPSRFAEHLKKHGGMTAHIMSVMMGHHNNKRKP